MFYQNKFVKSLQVINLKRKTMKYVVFTRHKGNWRYSEQLGQYVPDFTYCPKSWLFRLHK